MASVAESFKKIYQNRNIHIWLFLIMLVGAFLSQIIDNSLGQPNSFKQNIADIILNIFVGAYSLQFIRNALYNVNDKILPPIKEIIPSFYAKVIGINIIWGLYLGITLLLLILLYVFTKSIILPILIGLFILFLIPFIVYIYIALADTMNIKRLFDITLLYRFMLLTIKETYKKTIFWLLIFASSYVLYIFAYVIASLAGIDTLLPIAEDYYLFDVFMYGVEWYVIIIIFGFLFPYSLLDEYNDKIRTMFIGEQTDENA